jgi:hypothetical protein
MTTEHLHAGRGRRLYLTAVERQAFLEAAAKAPRPVRTLCGVLTYTGCRVSEALSRRRRGGSRLEPWRFEVAVPQQPRGQHLLGQLVNG